MQKQQERTHVQFALVNMTSTVCRLEQQLSPPSGVPIVRRVRRYLLQEAAHTPAIKAKLLEKHFRGDNTVFESVDWDSIGRANRDQSGTGSFSTLLKLQHDHFGTFSLRHIRKEDVSPACPRCGCQRVRNG